MRVLTRFLVVFMTLRTLVQPHGVCLCDLSQGLERSIVQTFHTHIPLGPTEKEDPRVGCVLCKVPAGVRVQHVPPPPRPGPSPEPLSLSPEVPAAAPQSFFDAPEPPLRPPDCALYLSQCSLLI